jgi:hypothetical protein
MPFYIPLSLAILVTHTQFLPQPYLASVPVGDIANSQILSNTAEYVRISKRIVMGRKLSHYPHDNKSQQFVESNLLCDSISNHPDCRAIAEVSNRGGPSLNPGQVMWDLWWTKWHWGRFSPSISVSLTNSHSTNCSILV